MIPEIGNLALSFAFALALIQFIVPLFGAATNRWRWVLVAAPATIGQFIFVLIAYVSLSWSFYVNDFSVQYVASHSFRTLPVAYRLAATWGGHEGALLLWIFMLNLWSLAVTMFSRQLPEMTRARVLAVLGGLSVGFLSFIIFTSNPFDRILPNFPLDGRDLNPLLQDPGMVIHPPMLYMGYVGFSVAFAFSITALIEGRIDSLWAKWVRPWTLGAWFFLTSGVALGSWWAYYELGWGGWWFWDPVENASFMPWLIGTALLHSLAATEKRGVFKAWTILLAIAAFSFSLLGTFLVRSGVLTSVHAFANDPVRGAFILAFLGIVVGASLILFAVRASTVSVSGWFDWLSKELLLLINNLLLTVSAVMILLGTLFPIFAEAFNWGKVSVGPPYFNLIFTVLMAPLVFLVGLGPIVRWRQYTKEKLLKQSMYAAIFAVIVAVVVTLLQSQKLISDKMQIGLGIFLVSWLLFLVLQDLFQKSKVKNKSKIRKLSLSYYGMHLAHMGLAFTVLGVVMSSHLSVEKNLRVGPGQSVTVSDYQFKLEGVKDFQGSNFDGLRGHFIVSKDGDFVADMKPEKRRYHASGQWMTEAAIDPALSRDLYVALGEQLPDGEDWAVRIYVKPFVRFIWFGALFMAIGGVFAIGDRRYRKKMKQKWFQSSPQNLVEEDV